MEHAEFIVFIDKIPPGGITREFTVADPAAVGIELSVPLKGALSAAFRLSPYRNGVSLEGTLRATAVAVCSRCLEEFDLPVESRWSASCEIPAVVEDEEDRELEAADLDVHPLAGGAVDLREQIAEQVHLALPLRALCRETCRGLCTHCGCNRNRAECSCVEERGDLRWEALKKLKARG